MTPLIRFHRAYEFTCPGCGAHARGMYQIADPGKGKSAPPLDHSRMVCMDVRGRAAGQPRAERFLPVTDAEFLPREWSHDNGCGATLAESEAQAKFAAEAALELVSA